MSNKNLIYNILWVIIFFTTLTLWFFLYKSMTTEYDENIAFLIYAILISILTSIILFYLFNLDNIKPTAKVFIKFFSLFLGTPIILIFIWIYFIFFQMRYVSTEYSVMPKNNFELEKFRNSFKSRNTLIDNDIAIKPDTIVNIIKSDGQIEELYRVIKGNTVKLKVGEIKYLTKEKMKVLTSY